MADLKQIATWMREERDRAGITTAQLAEMAIEAAAKEGVELSLSQQTISGFEQGNAKREPGWLKYIYRVLMTAGLEIAPEADGYVYVAELPTFAGAGGGGTGEGEEGRYGVDVGVLRHELKAASSDILAVVIEGNSMSPDFQSGDRVLIDKRKTSIAQPGAFCLWDGDGYVVKYLERIPGSEPAKVRVISKNETYSTFDRLVDEVRIMGRVVWFARKV